MPCVSQLSCWVVHKWGVRAAPSLDHQNLDPAREEGASLSKARLTMRMVFSEEDPGSQVGCFATACVASIYRFVMRFSGSRITFIS